LAVAGNELPRVFEVLREITVTVFGLLTTQNNTLANLDWPRYVRKLLSLRLEPKSQNFLAAV
jgi:hypothetical protein